MLFSFSSSSSPDDCKRNAIPLEYHKAKRTRKKKKKKEKSSRANVAGKEECSPTPRWRRGCRRGSPCSSLSPPLRMTANETQLEYRKSEKRNSHKLTTWNYGDRYARNFLGGKSSRANVTGKENTHRFVVGDDDNLRERRERHGVWQRLSQQIAREIVRKDTFKKWKADTWKAWTMRKTVVFQSLKGAKTWSKNKRRTHLQFGTFALHPRGFNPPFH